MLSVSGASLETFLDLRELMMTSSLGDVLLLSVFFSGTADIVDWRGRKSISASSGCGVEVRSRPLSSSAAAGILGVVV